MVSRYTPRDRQELGTWFQDKRTMPSVNILEVVPVSEHAAIRDGTSTYDAGPDFNRLIADLSVRGGGVVTVGAGRVRIDTPVVGADQVYFAGIGSGASLLDFTNITGASGTAAITATGSTSALPALADDIAVNTLTIEFVSDPGLLPDDLIRIFDKENYSFNRARSYYRAGEFARVKSVSGNVVTLTRPTYAGYDYDALTTTASLGGVAGVTRISVVKVNPVRVGFSGLSMRFPVGYRGINIIDGMNPFLDDLDLTGSDMVNLQLKRCYGVMMSRVRAIDFNDITFYGSGALGYGLVLSGCQGVFAVDNILEGGRHGMTCGSGSEEGDVPWRDISFTGGSISNNLLNSLYSFTADSTSGSNVLTNVSTFNGFSEDDSITGTGVPDDTLIVSVDKTAATMTLDQDLTTTATGATFTRTGAGVGITGSNLHGNGEDIRFTNVSFPRGVGIAGDKTKILGCHIGSGPGGVCIYGSGSEMLGWTHDIIGNTLEPTDHVSRNFATVFINAGSALVNAQRESGAFRFLKNAVTVGQYRSMDRRNANPALWAVETGLNIVQIQTSAGYANQKQLIRLFGVPTGGTFTLTYDGQTTAGIAYNATTADVQAALEALSNIAVGDVRVIGATNAWTVFFAGALVAVGPIVLLTADASSLTGGTSPSIRISSAVADHTCEIDGNTITVDGATFGSVYGVVVRATAGKAWKHVNITNNKLRGAGVYAQATNAETLTIERNEVDRALQHGIRVAVNATDTATAKFVTVRHNRVRRSGGCGLYLIGNATYDTLVCTDNTSLDNATNIGDSANSNLDSSAFVFTWLDATFQRNIVGDEQSVTTQTRSMAFSTITKLWMDANVTRGTVTTINRTSITLELARTSYDGTRVVAYGTAAPASGAWLRGDYVINSLPSSGGPPGWRCTTSGSPGTWKAEANLA